MFKDKRDERQVDWQLVPPGMHRRNAEERAILTFKKHFKAGLEKLADCSQCTYGVDLSHMYVPLSI